MTIATIAHSTAPFAVGAALAHAARTGFALWRSWRAAKIVIEPVVEAVTEAIVHAAEHAPHLNQPKGASTMQTTTTTPDVSIESISKAMSTAAAAVSATGAIGAQLYAFGAKMVASVENAYKSQGSGAQKRAAVIAAVQHVAPAIGTEYAAVAPEFEPWLETVVAAYNAAKALVNPSTPRNPSTPSASFNKMSDAEYSAVALSVPTAVPPIPTPAPTVAVFAATNTQGV